VEQERHIKQEETLDIQELLYVIKKQLLLVLILPIVCAGIAAGISFFQQKPVYQAGVSIIISKGEGNILTAGDVSMYQSLVKTYTEIAKSAVVAERAISYGNLEASVGTLQSSLTVSSEPGTQIFKMSVISGNAKDAVERVEALAQAFLQESRRLLPSGNVEIMDHAKVPQVPINSNNRVNIIVAFAIGLLTAIGFAFLLEYMRDTVKSEEDIERYFGVPILGVIPKHRCKEMKQCRH
jgi:capsular polysaccharide biosynthesis protein